MLIRFTVENFLNFRDETELVMFPGKGQQPERHVIQANNKDDISVLKTAVIFGPNASGKSNLVKAMETARNIILNKAIQSDHYFKFDKRYLHKPTTFEFEIKGPTYNYAYGFSYTQDSIHREWLYKITKSDQTLIFEKETKNGSYIIGKPFFDEDAYADQSGYEFIKKIADNMPANELLLKFANTKYSENIYLALDIGEAYDWFKSLIIIHPQYIYGGYYILPFENEFSTKFKDMIKLFDTGIDDITLKKIDIDDCDISAIQLNEAKNNLKPKYYLPHTTKKHNQYLLTKDIDNNFIIFEVMTHHAGADSNCWLKMSEESDGTKRLTDLLPILIKALSEKGGVFIVDELDRSLHPYLTKFFICTFLNKTVNTQLIFTSHDKGLQDQKIFRKDEIWYIEKNNQGFSTLKSLAEFKDIRKDLDIEKGYMDGRFGALPMVSLVCEKKKKYSITK